MCVREREREIELSGLFKSLHTPFFSASDKTIIVWSSTRDDTNYGIAKKSLHGHNHFAVAMDSLPSLVHGTTHFDSETSARELSTCMHVTGTVKLVLLSLSGFI